MEDIKYLTRLTKLRDPGPSQSGGLGYADDCPSFQAKELNFFFLKVTPPNGLAE